VADSILKTLATLPSGQVVTDLDAAGLTKYLRDYVGTSENEAREKQHRLRDELYGDGGTTEMFALIDAVFVNAKVKESRKAWAKWARFNNVTKRIVNELSSVYTEPATRSVSDPSSNAAYQLVLGLANMPAAARRTNRQLNLHRALFVWPVVTTRDGGKPPLIRLEPLSASNCRLITHPNDHTLIVAVAIRIRPRTAYVSEGEAVPAWMIWSAAEWFMTTDDWRVVANTWKTHSYGRIPGVFVSLDPPSSDSPWPGCAGDDLVAADMAIWFTAVLLLKEAKSATKQTITQGDMTPTERGQPSDSDVTAHLPDGVGIQTVDMSMDLSMFRDTADHVLEHVANNYGMSAALIKHQGVQSAEARELMRTPLKELRFEQQLTLRPFEHELADVLSLLLAGVEGLAFKTDGWRIDFGDPHTPLTRKEQLEVFEHERKLGLTNTIDFIKGDNPDLDDGTDDLAWKELDRNLEVELKRNEKMRPLQEISGSPGAETPAPPSEETPDEGNNPAA
jgi:hypothetical protein